MLDSSLAPNIYSTTDTATAAFLCISNFQLLRIDNNSERATFIFEDSDALRAAVISFDIGTAIANVSMFFRQYRKLLREIKQ